MRGTSSYMLAMELLPQRYRKAGSTLLMALEGTSYMVNALGMGYGKSFYAVLPFKIGCMIFTLTVIALYVPETPH